MVRRFSELPQDGQFVFRSMEPEGEHPKVARTNSSLGVRINAGDMTDITFDDEGRVHYGAEGMSVTPDDPMRLKSYRRSAAWGGRGAHPVWCLDLRDLGSNLAYVPDERNPANHGFIVPAHSMSLECFEEALNATCGSWEIVVP